MFFNPVQRKKLKVTSPFGKKRWDKIKKKYIYHKGTDLRCWDFIKRKHQPFIATENSLVLRVKRDSNDNGIIVLKPMESDYSEIKYIHVAIETCHVIEGQKIEGGHVLGYAEVRGQSKSLHLHFETLFDGFKIDPMIYIKKYIRNK